VSHIPEADMHHAAYYATALREYGQAFITAQGREAALRGFGEDWPQIRLGFDRVGTVSDRNIQAARVCVDFVNHPGVWLLDIYRPVTERLGWLELARRAATLLGDQTALVLIINNLGITNLNLGRPHEALQLHKEALEIARRIRHVVEHAHAISSIGICYKHLGRYREALQWHEKVLLLGQPYKLAHLRLNAFGNMGIALALLRKPQAACKHFDKVRKMARKLNRRREEGYALGNLGRAYRQMGRPKQAVNYHLQDLTISREMGNRRGEANALGDLGNALLDLGEISEALRRHREQLRIAETINQPEENAVALVNLSISLLYMNNMTDAETRRDQAVKLYEQMGNRAPLADLNERWSFACQAVGKPEEAIRNAENAIAILREERLPGVRRLQQRVARLRKEANDNELA
jgi:tetratricopeptide (TPR) repeat protein